MKIIKKVKLPNSQHLLLNQANINTRELYLRKNPTDKHKDWILISKKAIAKGQIHRTQFDQKTGKVIGDSFVKPATKYSSGSIKINDKTIKMNEPYHFFKGVLSNVDRQTDKGLVFLDAINPTPMARKFMKLVIRTQRALKN